MNRLTEASYRFPEGKRFAFTVFDDTDNSTVANVENVYRFLDELGMRTTKSVWVLPSQPGPWIGGSTLSDREYLRWVQGLKGFEIALHSIRNADANRGVVEEGLYQFENRLGFRPRSHANHLSNRENIYWGQARLSGYLTRLLYNAGTRFKFVHQYEGHVPSSEYFWGDICLEQITFVRNFVLTETNLLRVNPTIPYHNPAQPFVKFWFSSCDGGNLQSFCAAVSEHNQDRLEEEGGICIMYTHFASGFLNGTKLDTTFERLMRRLANKNGWYVPVSTLLDHLLTQRKEHVIPPSELAALERHWICQKIRRGPDRSGRAIAA